MFIPTVAAKETRKSMTKVVCISDTHCQLHTVEVPDGDVLIHAGDLTGKGSPYQISEELKAMSLLPHPHKIFIAGNHDWLFQTNPQYARSIVEQHPGLVYLQDDRHEVTIGDQKIIIYGSPWQPTFFDWAFNLDRGEPLARMWCQIPDETDVLVTHGPPYGILDLTMPRPATGCHPALPSRHVGCEDLLDAINRVKPKLHVFGHIHCDYGMREIDDCIFVNAAICTEQYKPTNKPIVVEI